MQESSNLVCLLGSCFPDFIVSAWLNGATAFAAIAAIGVAFFQLSRNREDDARRQTYAIIDRETSPEAEAIRSNFLGVLKKFDRDPAKLAVLADGPLDSDDVATLRGFMNRYEHVALLLATGAADLRLYAGYARTTIKRDWESLQPLIYALRQKANHPSMYCEFEWLAGAVGTAKPTTRKPRT